MNIIYKRGFTLAEVLITLGVIGVIAAITMPTVVKHYQKQRAINKLKKAYTVLNQALKMSEIDNGEFMYWEDLANGAEYFEKYWKPYLKVIKVCNTYSDCGYKSNTPFIQANGDKDAHKVNIISTGRVTFILNDGTLVLMRVRAGNYGDEKKVNDLFIDINAGSNPNVYGKDVFRFVRDEKGLLYPYGYNLSKDNIDTTCKSTGMTCAAKIISEGWKMSDDYPW